MFGITGSIKTNDTQVRENPWWKLITLGIIFILLLVVETAGEDWGGDFSQYIHHAANLVEGRPYAEIGYISNIFSFIGPVAYPPAFPLLLAPVYSLFGLDWFAFKIVVIVCFCLALYFVISLEQGKLSRAHQFAIIVILVLNPFIWWSKSHILSDFPFLLICLLTLSVLYKRYVKEAAGYNDTKNKNWYFSILMGLLLYLCYATREIGIVFVPAVLCFELFHFRKITLVTVGSLLIFLLLVVVQNVSIKTPEVNSERERGVAELAMEQGRKETQVSHTDFVDFNLTKIARQAERYMIEMRGMWPETESQFVKVAGWAAFVTGLLFAFAGYFRAVLLGPGILEIFVAGYLAILVLFGGFQGPRYLIPVLPFFFLYAFMLHNELLRSQYRNAMIAVAVFFVSATTIVYASNYDTYLNKEDRGITSPEAEAFFEYVKTSTPVDSVFVFHKPRVLSLLANRDASGWPSNTDPDFLHKYMNAIGAEYLAFSNIDWNRLSYPVDFIVLSEEKFTLDYRSDYFYVYKLNVKE